MYNAIPYIAFFTPDVQTDFWSVLRAILYVGMPFLMIAAATHFAGDFIAVIRNAFSRKGSDDYDRDSDDD